MTRIVLEQFAGIAPKVSPKKLGEALATIAENCRLDKGRVESWKGLLATGDSVSANPQSVFLYRDDWLAWSDDVDVVEHLVPNDIRERIVYTDDDYPKIRSGNAEYRLGIPTPSISPIATVTVGGDKSQLTYIRNQSYRVSFVDAWGAEGALSDPAITVEVGLNSTVELTLPAVPTGNYNFGNGARKRIYRSNSGTTSGIWQYAGEVPISQETFSDDRNPGDLQEAAVSEDWIGPPDDDTSIYPAGPLKGLIALPSGALAGFSGNVVCISQPYVPHAWPADYRVTIPDGQIVGISVLASGLLVCTNKRPYLIQGSSPAALLPVPLESLQACVAKRSIVDMGEYSIYASPDGLCLAQGNSVVLATEQLLDKHEWRAFEPETIKAWRYENKYFATFGTDGKGFVYDPAGDIRTLSTLQWPAVAGYLSVENDSLYVADAAGIISRFDAGDPLSFTWQSKEHVLPNPVGMSVLRIEAESYPVHIKVVGDGRILLERDVPSGQPVRIPGGSKSKVWQVAVSGTNPVEYVMLADSMAEVF